MILEMYEILFPIQGYDCDSIRRQVQSLIPNETRDQARMLYRLEGPVARVRMPRPSNYATSRMIQLSIRKKCRYMFSLRANVIKRVSLGNGRSKRVPDQDWEGWMLRHQYGFEVHDFRSRFSPECYGETSDKFMTYLGVDYSGILECVDELGLANAVLSGIGRAKCYGFGLLLEELI